MCSVCMFCAFWFLDLACNIPSLLNYSSTQQPSTSVPSPTSRPLLIPITGLTSEPSTALPVVDHLMEPNDVAPKAGEPIYDVDSSGTGPEKRAPYGDSYKINRFERPFLQDMTYVPDMDITSFTIGQDEDWYYITLELIGENPNNALGINYGVEIDLNMDGFGDYLVWAHPPYITSWGTSNVQVFKDSNFDSGGVSADKSDETFNGNGYDSLVFDGNTVKNDDPDLAWVRMIESQKAAIQFAFKKSLTGSSFILGVIADGGLKDVSKFDYNDHFPEVDAGSPVRDKIYYPLGSLYAVDNTCWEALRVSHCGQ